MSVPHTLCVEPLPPAAPDTPLTVPGSFVGASSCSGAHSDIPLQPLQQHTSVGSSQLRQQAGRVSQGGSRGGSRQSLKLCDRTQQFITQPGQYSPRRSPASASLDSGGLTTLSGESRGSFTDQARRPPFRWVSALLPNNQLVTQSPQSQQAGLHQKWEQQQQALGAAGNSFCRSMQSLIRPHSGPRVCPHQPHRCPHAHFICRPAATHLCSRPPIHF